MSLTPQRLRVADEPDGSRRVTLSCYCIKVGVSITRWESLPSTIEQLRADHDRLAPSCRHPYLDNMVWIAGR